MLKILVYNEQSGESEIFQLLIDQKYSVNFSNSLAEAESLISSQKFNIIFLDLRNDEKIRDLIIKIKNINPSAVIIIIVEKSTVTGAVDAMKLGAYEYITKPFHSEKIISIIEDITKMSVEKIEIEVDLPDNNIIGANNQLKKILKKIQIIANTKVTALITGESGTGKELIASALHNLSDRRNKPFITVNCAALPANLIESELFGYEKGAFTGAIRQQTGKFEAANDGSIFIDEIGDMDLAVQAKLLRTIENREITRLGSTKTVKINTRFIFATNKDLFELVKKNLFREDLYYRINVVKLELPPLRDRRDDIPALFKYYFKYFCKEYNKQIHYIAPDVLKTISLYYWPGNIRQFKNVVENIVVLNETGKIRFEDLPEDIIKDYKPEPKENILMFNGYQPTLPRYESSENFKLTTLAELEKNAIINTLKSVNYNKTKTAQILNVSLRTIQRKLKEYGLENEIIEDN